MSPTPRALLAPALTLALTAGAAPAAEPPPPGERYTKNVAIVLYDGVEVLDFAGPAEVFAAAAGYGARAQEPAFDVYTVGRTRAPLVSQGFLDIVPDYSIEDSPRPDIVVLPGGGSDRVRRDPTWMRWIEEVGRDADQILTVCTGAFIAGQAGFLEGTEATTWYGAIARLTREFPETVVHTGRRFVDNGKVVTTAGVSAGIDGSLHLVARLLGRYVADRTAEYMEYKWSPESYQSSRYTQLNPRLDARGRALQQGSIAAHEGDLAAATAIFRSLAEADAGDAEAWLQLGRTLHAQRRHAEAIPAYLEAAKAEPQRGDALFSLACAYALAGQRSEALAAAELAVAAGFRARYFWENDEDLAAIRDDPRFQALVAAL